jgi:hypothetical protein
MLDVHRPETARFGDDTLPITGRHKLGPMSDVRCSDVEQSRLRVTSLAVFRCERPPASVNTCSGCNETGSASRPNERMT